MAKRKKTPQNKVGHYVPTAAEVEAERERIRQVTAFADHLGPALETADRKRLSRPRLGSEPTADIVLDLARKHGLTSRLLSVDAAENDLALYKSIAFLTKEAFVAWQRLRDVYAQARSEHWETVLYFYGVLDQMAQNDPKISQDLQPVVEFFALGPQEDTEGKDQAQDKEEEGLD